MRLTSYLFLLPTLFLAPSCGGGGSSGGGDTTSPTIIAAVFVGLGISPAAGDGLVLSFSEDIALVSGAVLDDADVLLSSGTLGSVGSPPTLLSTRSLQIVLGAGTNFSPGVDMISFSPSNDVVRDLSGNLGMDGVAQLITAGDGDLPSIDSLTLNDIDTELNGSGPAGGTLQTPNTGFSIDMTYSDATSAIDPARIEISANVQVLVNGVFRAIGSDLTDVLTVSSGAGSASLSVPPNVVFSTGSVTLTATVADVTGMVSAPVIFPFLTATPTAALRPFETAQTWFLDCSRDLESYTTLTISGSVSDVVIVDGANGSPDLEDLFHVVGLFSAAPIANVLASMDSNEVVMNRFQAQLTAELATLFPSVSINFTFTAPGSFPSGVSSVPYGNLGFSQICIAGAATTGPSGILGSALFDPRNSFQNNNCIEDFSGSRLGVFMHTMIRIGYLSGGPSSIFRITYDPLTTAIGGIAIGDDKPDDAARLQGVLIDARSNMIDQAIDRIARIAAVVLAHECGHSMGLVTNLSMPVGLYGADPINFPLSVGLPDSAANGHIQNSSLFPPGSQNIMSPAISLEAALSSATGFNSLNLAYLREQALYND